MRLAKIVIFSVALVSGAGCPAQDRGALPAGFKCWKNKDGVQECGNAVPPEYAQQSHTTYSSGGMTVGMQQAAKSAQQFAEEQRQAGEKAAADREARARAAADKVLLQTFSSADDVVLARDGRVSTVEGQIKLTESRKQKFEANLRQLVKSAADLERGAKPISPKLVRDIETVRNQIADSDAFVVQKRQEIENIRQKFDTDLRRWQELKAAR